MQQLQTSLLTDILMNRDGIGNLLRSPGAQVVNDLTVAINKAKATLADASKAAAAAHEDFRVQCAKDMDILRFHHLDNMSTTAQGKAFASTGAGGPAAASTGAEAPAAPPETGPSVPPMTFAKPPAAEVRPAAARPANRAAAAPVAAPAAAAQVAKPPSQEAMDKDLERFEVFSPDVEPVFSPMWKSGHVAIYQCPCISQVFDAKSLTSSYRWRIMCDAEMHDADGIKLTCNVGGRHFADQTSARKHLTQHKSDVKARMNVSAQERLKDMRSHKLEGGKYRTRTNHLLAHL